MPLDQKIESKMMSFPTQTTNHGRFLAESYDGETRYDRGLRDTEGPSRLMGPILPTPGYELGGRPTSAPATPSRVPRVHGTEAKLNYKRATASSGIPFMFEVRGSGVFPGSGTNGKPPKNHMNENLRRIRRIARETRSAKVETQRPMSAKEMWRSKQYDHVQSKVKQQLDEDTRRSMSRPPSAQGNFLRAHGKTGAENFRSQSVHGSRRGSFDSVVNQSTSVDKDTTKPDYVKLNTQFVKSLPKTRKATTEAKIEQAREKNEKQIQSYLEKQKGRVPDYIEKLKQKQAQDDYERRMNAPDPECPPGHVKVDDAQRLSTLKQLQLNRQILEKKFAHLPIRNDSLTLRQAKEDIEKKIVELDEAIKIFSKPKVFVRLEE